MLMKIMPWSTVVVAVEVVCEMVNSITGMYVCIYVWYQGTGYVSKYFSYINKIDVVNYSSHRRRHNM